ncbi:MAG: hypothetical protein HDS26_06190 [Bacteroides sp.]|nr:hypothetical protein [Bacteroides sp.]
MKQIFIYTMCLIVALTSCTTNKLPIFSSQTWHIDHMSGNAVSSSGMKFGFGSEWLIRDTTLIQTSTQLQKYPKLECFLAKVISQFPEISIDSIYFYNPARGLLFASYHQEKALKPTADIKLYNDTASYYSRDYFRIFGDMTTYIEEDGWEIGPIGSVYTNLYYSPKDKEVVLLQRIPYKRYNIAVYHIRATIPKKGEWWNDYPRGMFWETDLGDTNNMETISSFLHSSRTTAIANLNLTLPKE